ncbi:hypothetical protein ACVWXU_004004 [Streptomyces sp. TE33382]
MTPTRISSTTKMLMPKAHRQEYSASQPPSNGPTAAAAPIVDPQTAKALPRSGPRKVMLSKASDVGITIAPPMPCTNRLVIRKSPVGDNAAATLASPKTMVPIRNSLRAPTTSEIRPITSSRAAKVIA